MESSYCCSLWYHYTYLVIFWTNELEGDKRKQKKTKTKQISHCRKNNRKIVEIQTKSIILAYI
jgi:hypothetical protein